MATTEPAEKVYDVRLYPSVMVMVRGVSASSYRDAIAKAVERIVQVNGFHQMFDAEGPIPEVALTEYSEEAIPYAVVDQNGETCCHFEMDEAGENYVTVDGWEFLDDAYQSEE